jgi:ABC-2 type transport system permease protein
VSRAGTISWFAYHEWRLAWRDWLWLMSGRRWSKRRVALGLIAIALFLHGFAYLVLYQSADLSRPPDKRMLAILTGTLALYGPMMLSQAMEAVTRAFYGRGDLDLILSSPVAAWRLFAVRIGAIAVTIAVMSLVLAAPFINILAWFGGLRWLAAYGVIIALAMVTVAVAVILTVALFRTIGPKYTRLAAQIVAAVIGASFVIGVQLAAILSYGTPSRFAFLQSEAVIRYAPDSGSTLWLPARAILGDMSALVVVFGISAIIFAATISIFAPRFGHFALATAGVSGNLIRRGRRSSGFRRTWPTRALRGKEWTLLQRDPWLVSQILMQLLYLLPPALILWRSFHEGSGPSTLLVPILIMAAGQLAGDLAWLAVSGDDAPDLIASAPVTNACVLRAKTEAVMGAIAIVFGPFVIALAVVAHISALVTALGVATAAASATSIQFWFRVQAKRSQFRRCQTSSRIATFAEALSSCSWAGVGALAAAGTWLATIPGLIAFSVVMGAWIISPAKRTSHGVGLPWHT